MIPNSYFIIFFITILIILGFLYKIYTNKLNNKEIYKLNNQNIPYNLWLYWENIKGKEKPTYIQLCHDTVIKNSGIKTIILNENNINEYLPNLRKDLNKLTIPQKADYIRLSILNRYGGMWMDSDIIVFKNIKPLFEKLKVYDYVGFGCHHTFCKYTLNGINKPANWALISRKNGIFINKCLKEANRILDSNINLQLYYNYHKLGRELLWTQIKYLKNNTNWDYFHFTSKFIERDEHGNKYNNNRFLSKEILTNTHDSFFTPLYNTAPGFPHWFLNMNKKQIMNDDMLISQLFRKALL